MGSHTDSQTASTRAALVALLAATTLAGCGEFNVRRELGVIGKGPDEFRVVSNERLEMPEQMPGSAEQLPEPKPGAQSLVEPTPVKDAQQVFKLDGVVSGDGAASASEKSLLAAAEADAAESDIRDKLSEDESLLEENARLLDGLLGNDPDLADALDPEEEMRRLAREAQQTKNPDLVVPEAPDKASKSGG